MASTGNLDAKNTSNVRFEKVLSEIWPPEVFWVSKFMWASADATWLHADGSKKSKNSRRPYSLKTVQIGHLRYFLASTFLINAKKTPQMPDLDKFRVRYGLQKFFGSKNSCGLA